MPDRPAFDPHKGVADATGRPAVSVVMPLLNPHPVYFRQAIASVLGQTFKDFELIIVEEAGARTAQDMLGEFRDPRIRHIFSAQRTSQTAQRNRALAAARAELVASLDADDIAHPRRLEKQVAFMNGHPDVSVLGSQLAVMDSKGQHLGYRAYPHDHESIVRTMPRANPIAHPSVMCRRSAVLAEGGYRLARYAAEDYELWSRLAHRGLRFANHPEPLLRYRIHPEGIKTRMLRSVLRGTLEVKRRYWADQMSLAARTRLLAEHLLLCVPPSLVLKAFLRTHYRKDLPGQDSSLSWSVPA